MWQEPFDNDVKMYGIQTVELVNCDSGLFENDVKMYGIQTIATDLPPLQIV